jgi:Pyruvate/2-oxoacid:ferredoxin oxidoreductase delta subunit
MRVNLDVCTKCSLCVRNCPVAAIDMRDSRIVFLDNCVACGVCAAICPESAIRKEAVSGDFIECDHCMVGCRIRKSFTGACGRYRNENGILKITRALEIPKLSSKESCLLEGVLSEPLITAIGSGTTYPDYEPAPLVVEKSRYKVDVVTAVTEVPLTMSTVQVKVDTKKPIGEETARVKYKGEVVGHVTTEQYGAKMLSIGGSKLIKNSNPLGAVRLSRLMTEICNKEPFTLNIEGGAKLVLQVGKSPIVDGEETPMMEVGCGTAIIGMFGKRLKEIADEVIVLDSDITCLASESYVGKILGFSASGIIPPGRHAGMGRYHPTPGTGWGGTQVNKPLDAIASVDRSKLRTGLRVFIIEVTGSKAAMLEVTQDLSFREVDMSSEARKVWDQILENAEYSQTSALYIGGAGGSARAGITPHPVKLNRAIHDGKIKVTVGGSPAFVFPGGGITFMVDIGKIKWQRPFGWVPYPPAVVVPLEYTMTKDTYFSLEGHKRNLILYRELKEGKLEKIRDYHGSSK